MSRLQGPRRKQYSDDEILSLAAEAEVAKELGVPWKLRGPPPPTEGGPSTWRGQQYRHGSGRWGNRGGKYREYYKMLYSGKGKGKDKDAN